MPPITQPRLLSRHGSTDRMDKLQEGGYNGSGGGAYGSNSPYFSQAHNGGGGGGSAPSGTAMDEDSDGEYTRTGTRRVRTAAKPHVPHLTTTAIIATILLSMAILLVIVVVSVPPGRRAQLVVGGGGGAEALAALAADDAAAAAAGSGGEGVAFSSGGLHYIRGSSGHVAGGGLDAAAVRARARAAVLGALVADAASMGLHWLYDPDKVDALLRGAGRAEAPEFFEPPSCPYYKYPAGAFTPYGDELLPVLAWLAAHDDMVGHGQAWAEFLAKYYRAYSGRLNKSSRNMAAAVLDDHKPWPTCGDPADTQANAFVKVVPLVARYAGSPHLAEAVHTAVRAQQNNDAAVNYALAAARILEKVVMGSSVTAAVAWAASPVSGLDQATVTAIGNAVAVKDKPMRDLVHKRFGASCANPGALQGSLAAALGGPTSKAYGGGYVGAVRANLVQGGDNASRAVLLGALLAAQDGWEAVPEEWRNKTTGLTGAEALVDQLLDRADAVHARAAAAGHKQTQT